MVVIGIIVMSFGMIKLNGWILQMMLDSRNEHIVRVMDQYNSKTFNKSGMHLMIGIFGAWIELIKPSEEAGVEIFE